MKKTDEPGLIAFMYWFIWSSIQDGLIVGGGVLCSSWIMNFRSVVGCGF